MSTRQPSSGLPFAAALLLVAAFGLVGAVNIESSALAGKHDPGAKALPLGLSICLLVCGLVELAVGVKRFAKQRLSAGAEDYEGLGKATSHTRLGIAFIALVVYVGLTPWIGFQLSTLLFAGVMLYQLGAKWWSAVLTAGLLVAAIRLVFVSFLYVQLPKGVFDLAF